MRNNAHQPAGRWESAIPFFDKYSIHNKVFLCFSKWRLFLRPIEGPRPRRRHACGRKAATSAAEARAREPPAVHPVLVTSVSISLRSLLPVSVCLLLLYITLSIVIALSEGLSKPGYYLYRLHSTLLYCTIKHSTVLHSMRHNKTQDSTVQVQSALLISERRHCPFVLFYSFHWRTSASQWQLTVQ